MVLRFDSMAPRLIGDYAIKARARTTLGTLVSQQREKILFQQSKKFLLGTGKLSGCKDNRSCG
jgi:hypothetical protein